MSGINLFSAGFEQTDSNELGYNENHQLTNGTTALIAYLCWSPQINRNETHVKNKRQKKKCTKKKVEKPAFMEHLLCALSLAGALSAWPL